ncbi:MAG TPA: hypothetical protein VFC63_09630 [Blastocatellia bacterium]|nr:hypothetical protein [Blastocatellia bacterium]
MRNQQLRFQNWRYYDNPYYYAAPIYRYYYGGSYYTINEYGAGLLRDAVNSGYNEGYLAGQADRQDGYSFSPDSSFAYQDATLGYSGFLDEGEYSYYFRQGFERGYQDGYYGRFQYGSYVGGVYSIQAPVLGGILNFTYIH